MIRRSICGFLLAFASTALAVESNVALPRYPSVSPDGRSVTFSWRGDLWTVATTGGAARRLTSHPADELFSGYSRDGKRIAFTSTRNGYQNLYVMNTDGTGITHAFNSDRPVVLNGWTRGPGGDDVLVFSSRLSQANMPDTHVYLVPPTGGEPQLLFGAFGYSADVSPDGTRVLFNRGTSGWSRRHYRGSDSREIWMYDRNANTYTRLTTWPGNDGRARWVDNDTFVFTSDRQDNCVNLYRLSLGQKEETAERLTRFTDTDVEDIAVSGDGKTLVFAMWDRLYRMDLSRVQDGPIAIDITADEDTADLKQIRPVDRSVSAVALSPDGKALAVVAYGQVYVRGAEGKGPARRGTDGPARHRDVAWSADGEKLFFVGDADGVEKIYAATVKLARSDVKKQVEQLKPRPAEPASQPAPATQDSDAGAERKPDRRDERKDDKSRWPEALSFEFQTVVDSTDLPAFAPSPSPDGKRLAYRLGAGQLWVLDLATKESRRLVDGWSTAMEWRWSPDSQRIAYVTEDKNNNADVWMIDADGESPAVNISRHPDNDSSPCFSADGKVLAFLSDRVNNESDVYMVYLDKSLETLTPPELEQYYKDAAAAAKKREPVKKASTTRPASQPATRPVSTPEPPDLDDAYLRLRRITSMPGSERSLEIAPAGDKFYFTAQSGAQRSTFVADREGGEPKRLGAGVNIQHISFDGDKLVVIDSGPTAPGGPGGGPTGGGGRAALMKLPAGEIEAMDVSDRLTIDLAAQSRQKFLEAARIIGQAYYDPKMNGLDWPRVTARYAELAGRVTTPDEFDYVANRLLGELNGSHLGINSPDPASPLQQPMGRLGIQRKRLDGNAYEVTEIFENGPAAKGPMRLEVGDVIAAVEGQSIGATDTLESMLQGRVGKETLFTVRRAVAGGEAKEVQLLLTPISFEAEAILFYNHWRNATARKVDQMSGGKLGYIHIRGMDQNSLDVFERDLYAAADGKQGLIIDVRNNGGGWTADRLLASIMYPRHAYTRPRGVPENVTDAYPQDRLFIQRYNLPINMLCNENSFSNAEIIAHAFKTLKRGTLVGQRTAGGVISTGGTALIDGTTVRLPFRGWYLPDGKNMELNGAMPDLLVPQTPESEENDDDAQLKAAVDDLLKRLN